MQIKGLFRQPPNPVPSAHMMFDRLYYSLKPYIPWVARILARRRWALWARAANAAVWPIDEKAAVIPTGWPGWPGGSRFAVVLTHDVEGTKGLSRVERLVRLEQDHGFRSSFNFVPEGHYRVPHALRKTLDLAGFEVGIHGLHHDGKLYSSKATFAKRAAAIRRYAREWNAVGFRSPFMHHNLAWLHELGMEYDGSTFDTDPFEPQSDGSATIFPFWVPRPDGAGYVELPYTLVQDFSLFVVLRERNIDLWKRKLDWVAAHGGMVLLNTHPDYMCFEGRPRRDEFPITFYEELLEYIRNRHQGKFWHALPREVARYYCRSVPAERRNTRRKICMVAYTAYERDNRVRRYAEALAKRGDEVEVIAHRSTPTQARVETIEGVTVYRNQYRTKNEHNKWTFAWRLLRFLATSSLFVAHRHSRVRYDLVHVHNVPDFLVLAACYPKWTGAKVILDIHDIVPELFASKFKAGHAGWYVSLLRRTEKLSASFADHVIVSNHLWQKTLIARSVPEEKCSVVLNHVDTGIFYQRQRTRTPDDRFIILFPGSFQWHQGLDIAIKALARLRRQVPRAELHLYGCGNNGIEERLAALANSLGLNASVKFFGGVALDEMPDVIANADLGVVPKRADSFGNEAYSTKIMEFMSQGVPVVVSRTKIDEFYFDDGVVRFFKSGDDEEMAKAMLDIIQHPELRRSLVANAYRYVEQNGWGGKKDEYLALVDRLLHEPFQSTPTIVAPRMEIEKDFAEISNQKPR
jgi:glycosyltransferase involved in cell wall biosynthesis/peptidoglycan/xylan/chitin deacetylase (PgdA/CDA1 family)